MKSEASEMRVVIFDLGGVVVKVCRGWNEAAERVGVPRADESRFALPDLQSSRRELSDAYQRGQIESHEYFERIADATDGLYTPEQVERVHRAWVMEAYDGIAELIDALNALDGIETACLSNTNAAHWDDLKRGAGDGWGAISRLGHPFVSHEVGMVKPHAEIYEAVRAQLGRDASSLIFFDDLEENVRAARDAGWHAFQIDHTGDTARQARAALRPLGFDL
ncbi:MAG: HAD-IA family hydrolase [Planctomycetota bacterium]